MNIRMIDLRFSSSRTIRDILRSCSRLEKAYLSSHVDPMEGVQIVYDNEEDPVVQSEVQNVQMDELLALTELDQDKATAIVNAFHNRGVDIGNATNRSLVDSYNPW